MTYATIWFETLDTFAPLGYVEAPCTQALLHNRPMEEDLIEFATIFKLDNTESIHSTFCQLMKMGILPTVQQLFTARPWDYPVQFQLWLDTIHFYVKHKLLELQCKTRTSTYLTVTDMDSCIQLIFYPIGAIGPTLHCRPSTKQYFFTYESQPYNARAAMVETKPSKTKTKFIQTRDPSVEEIGDPSNLINYLPDSGATQHMTPHSADLFDMVEGQNLGVEVADGHVIKCSITGKI